MDCIYKQRLSNKECTRPATESTRPIGNVHIHHFSLTCGPFVQTRASISPDWRSYKRGWLIDENLCFASAVAEAKFLTGTQRKFVFLLKEDCPKSLKFDVYVQKTSNPTSKFELLILMGTPPKFVTPRILSFVIHKS